MKGMVEKSKGINHLIYPFAQISKYVCQTNARQLVVMPMGM